ncbi:hypothetical protein MNEG_5967 [Monoraphidium neglectum]|uniref:Cyclin N-terminal domain-containing protein n=1 Tax=Monoraphidium neglectum TaxID=145388 RepID=A0A0D2MFU1_9CHLO|nr:hypothetical protein MNEG_5967 [Monoraphidium neglectum]KIZ01990.1 hypothetical protein MNEG_5967 [Monoraphidium neglectum]|eukprot:XP_013901009.1 hypothetical protein MNEG_5967 [Monoraphidium neglectum]
MAFAGSLPSFATSSLQKHDKGKFSGSTSSQSTDTLAREADLCTSILAERRPLHHSDREAGLMPDPRYLDAAAAAAAAAVAAGAACGGEGLTPQMRAVVVSWLVEVAGEFRLQPETLHLSVALLDRFLSAAAPHGVPRGVLQMVAVSCVMVACKGLEVRRGTRPAGLAVLLWLCE